MSKNKLAKFAELNGYDHVIQLSFDQLRNEGFVHKGTWNSSVFKNNNPIVLELGCGKGEYTVGLARLFPDKNFIGLDIKGARMWSGAKEAKDLQLSNVAFIRTHIELLEYYFNSGEVSEIWITFPDPQMKKWRKRLTSTRFLETYRKVMKENGIIHLKTDSNFLYQYTCATLDQNRFEVEIKTDNLYESGLADEILGIRTYYEQQWLGRGKTIKYLKYKLHSDILIEPDIEIEPDDYRSFGRNNTMMTNPIIS